MAAASPDVLASREDVKATEAAVRLAQGNHERALARSRHVEDLALSRWDLVWRLKEQLRELREGEAR